MYQKQVLKDHYEFEKYYKKWRWPSVWHQVNELSKFGAVSILEIGPGKGLLKAIADCFGMVVTTADIDDSLEPDIVCDARSLAFDDQHFEVACAFQMLEHVPYADSLIMLRELLRVSSKGVVISLPDAKTLWTFRIHLPKIGGKYFHIQRPWFGPKELTFNGEHYWEVNTKNYELPRILSDFRSFGYPVSSYRVPENPYHRFFVITKGFDAD